MILLMVAGEFAYGSNYCIHVDYQGNSITYQFIYLAYEYMLAHGYERYCSHAINEIAQKGQRKAYNLHPEIKVEVEDMYVQDTRQKPFVGLNIRQIVFQIDMRMTLRIFHNFQGSKL